MRAFHTSILVSLIAFLVAWTGLGSPARAADTALAVGSGSLTVQTVDALGKPVAGALVNVFPSGGSSSAASGTTNASGKISFSGLATGTYSVFASKVIVVSGFPSAIFGSATVTVSKKPAAVIVPLVQSAP